MLFNSYAFLLVFLPAALIIYALADPYPRARMPVLLALSLVFYGYWDVRFLPLLVASILVNWLAAKWYVATKRGWIVTAAIVANLAALGFFKYMNFFAETVTAFGLPVGPFSIVLPLGISFFTFHHVMYLVDLRRGKAPEYPLDRYAMYIAFFPQAIAGPLARWSEVMHQFGRRVYAPGWQRQFALGVTFIAIGLIEKTLLGDPIGRIIDPIYAQAKIGAVPDGQSWLALGFIFQILFDFAGYSDIAIGLGLLFGVQLPYNFNAPFRSTNMQDFWQRWHMTLMTFLRDYLFHPLANARIVTPPSAPAVLRRPDRHHGAVRAVARAELDLRAVGYCAGCRGGDRVLWRRYGWRMPNLVGWAMTMVFALWFGVLFRAGSLEAAWNVYQGLTILPDLGAVGRALPIIVAGLVACLVAGKPGHRGVAQRATAQGGCGGAWACCRCDPRRTG